MSDHVAGRDAVYAGMKKIQDQQPKVMAAFGGLHEQACADGKLDAKTKELISLGIAIAIRCEGCIDCHVSDALKLGATLEEIAETVSVAILMGGGPSVVYGAKAIEAAEQMA